MSFKETKVLVASRGLGYNYCRNINTLLKLIFKVFLFYYSIMIFCWLVIRSHAIFMPISNYIPEEDIVVFTSPSFFKNTIQRKKKPRQQVNAASAPAPVRASGGGEVRRWPTRRQCYLCYFIGEILILQHIWSEKRTFEYFAPLPQWQSKTATSDTKRYVFTSLWAR